MKMKCHSIHSSIVTSILSSIFCAITGLSSKLAENSLGVTITSGFFTLPLAVIVWSLSDIKVFARYLSHSGNDKVKAILGQQKPPKLTPFLILQALLLGSLGGLCTCLWFIALDYAPLGDVNSLLLSSSVITLTIIDHILIHRKCPSVLTGATVGLGVVGITLVCSPGFLTGKRALTTINSGQLIALVLSLIATVSQCIYFPVMCSYKYQNVPNAVHTFSYMSWTSGLSLAAMVFQHPLQLGKCDITSNIYSSICGVACFSGVHFAICASRSASTPSAAMILRLLGVVLAYCAQVIFLDEPVFLDQLVGTVMIGLSFLFQAAETTYGSLDNIMEQCNCFISSVH